MDRVGALRAEVAARHCADLDALMAKLEAIFRRAYEHYQFHAAARAVALQARLAGLLPERLSRPIPLSPDGTLSGDGPPPGDRALADDRALPGDGRLLPDAPPRLISGPCVLSRPDLPDGSGVPSGPGPKAAARRSR